MRVNNKPFQSIWFDPDKPGQVSIINQLLLPYDFELKTLKSVEDVYHAIADMEVRGAPLIGVTAAWGIYLACYHTGESRAFFANLQKASEYLASARPTAINLSFAINHMMRYVKNCGSKKVAKQIALREAMRYERKEIDACLRIGENGVPLIQKISEKKKGETVNILTHCNAGWLACVDYGTATAPIYLAYDRGIDLHVWVDETRPRNQGARLTAWELGQHGIPHTIIPDSTGAYLMQQNLVDMVIVGSDRTSRRGDVANKIGTYQKALSAKIHKVPFYVALPTSSIDMNIRNGMKEIPIEKRSADEVHYIEGVQNDGPVKLRISPDNSQALNYAFDVTPAKLVKALITEKGIVKAKKSKIRKLFK